MKALITAIEAVYAGETYFANEAKESVFQALQNKEKKNSPLSSREIQIVKLIAHQMTSAKLAAKLHLSLMTVETHRKNIYLKLAVHNVAGLIQLAMKNGWIE